MSGENDADRLQEIRDRLRHVPDPVAVLEGIFAYAPVGLQLYGVDGHCLLTNRAFRELFGTEPPPDYNVLNDEIAAAHGVLASIRRAFTGETVTVPPVWYDARELTQVRVADGRRVAFESTFFPLFDAAGVVTHVAVVFRDVTAEKRAEQEREAMLVREQAARAEAEAANRAKDEFLAMLGHELRNPLAPIVTALQLMKLRGDTRTAREQQVIARQVQHVVRLVDDLLDVSRITRGKVELRRERVGLAEVVAKAVEIASPLLEQRRHYLTVEVEPALEVCADPVRLAQVVANLLTNAARYTEPGGQVTVRAAREADDRAVISVRDTGIGIGPELLPRVFDLFVQGARATDRAEGGLGLGLALVRCLVEMHGGEVTAHSDGPGRGSEFVVRLTALAPRAETQPAAARGDGGGRPSGTTRGPAPRAAAHPRDVLLVDDNVDAADTLADVLRSVGHRVAVAHDGPAALAKLARFRPAVALLDLGLPVMDGYALASRLRAELGTSLRVIALTGYGQDADRARSHAAGFSDHLVKPVDPEHLLALLED